MRKPLVAANWKMHKTAQEAQLVAALADVELSDPSRLVLAHEPVWAIGMGVAAQPEDAQDMAGRIRGWLAGRFGPQGAVPAPPQ